MSAIQQLLMSYKKANTYATWNPSDKDANITLSWWNLVATSTAWWWKSARATIGKSSGKWYWEVVVSWPWSWNAMIWVGSGSDALNNFVWFNSTWWSYYSYGGKVDPLNWYNNNSNFTYWAAYTLWDVIGVALNMDAWELTFYKNNVSQWVISWLSGTMYPMCSPNDNTLACTANFWATTLTYTPPTWFNAWLYN